MILKCIKGPMDGAVYALSRETSDPSQRSTNRKPDGLWFDGQDDEGRNVQHHYKFDRAMPLVECKEPVVLEYLYNGQVEEVTTPGFCEHGVVEGDWCEPCNIAFKQAQSDPDNGTAQPLTCASCGEESTNPGQFVKDGRWVCTEHCRKELASIQSYDDLAASGGIVDAP